VPHPRPPGFDSAFTGLNLSKGTSSHVPKTEPFFKETNTMNESKSHDRDTNVAKNLKKVKPSSDVLERMAVMKEIPTTSTHFPGIPLADHVKNQRAKSEGRFDGPTASAAEKRKRLALLRQDPLNVHQKVLKHLQSPMRPPITSIYDVASLVVHSCINVFDQYQVPDEFRFFEFFERSIGVVVSRVIYSSSSTVVLYSYALAD
jgi:hypothetical protein